NSGLLLRCIKFDAAEQVEVEHTGSSVIERREHQREDNDNGDVHPFRWIAEQVQEYADGDDQRDRKCIANIHCPLVESGLGLQHNVAVGTTLIHHVELGDPGNGIFKNIAL